MPRGLRVAELRRSPWASAVTRGQARWLPSSATPGSSGSLSSAVFRPETPNPANSADEMGG